MANVFTNTAGRSVKTVFKSSESNGTSTTFEPAILQSYHLTGLVFTKAKIQLEFAIANHSSLLYLYHSKCTSPALLRDAL